MPLHLKLHNRYTRAFTLPSDLKYEMTLVKAKTENDIKLVSETIFCNTQNPLQSPSGTSSPSGIFSPGAQVSKEFDVMVSPP